jgi:hypothetical protein
MYRQTQALVIYKGANLMTSQPNTRIKAKLTQITYDTSLSEVFGLASSLNPYPDQAARGVLVWNDTKGSNLVIKYLETGNCYEVVIPYVPISSFEAPQPCEEPQPYEIPALRRWYGAWVSLEAYYNVIASEIVSSHLIAHADFGWVQSKISWQKSDKLEYFTAEHRFRKSISLIRECIASGELATAFGLLSAVMESDVIYTSQGEIDYQAKLEMSKFKIEVAKRLFPNLVATGEYVNIAGLIYNYVDLLLKIQVVLALIARTPHGTRWLNLIYCSHAMGNRIESFSRWLSDYSEDPEAADKVKQFFVL